MSASSEGPWEGLREPTIRIHRQRSSKSTLNPFQRPKLLELGESNRGSLGHKGLKQAMKLRQRAGDAMLRKIPNKIMQIHAIGGSQCLKDHLYIPEEAKNVQTNRLRQSLQRGIVWRGQNKTSLGASSVSEKKDIHTYNQYWSPLH